MAVDPPPAGHPQVRRCPHCRPYDTSDATAWSVVVRGVGHDIWEKDESIHALALPLLPWHEGSKPRFVRIEPTSVTGRRLHVVGGFTRDCGQAH